MICDLQRASMWKRIAASLFDWILTGVAAVGIALLLSVVLDYDSYSRELSDVYVSYEEAYGVSFDMTGEEYSELTDEQKARYDEAQEAFLSDEKALYAYNMTVNLTMIIVTMSIMVAVMLFMFVLPLIFGNGQTLGKKAFSIGVIRTDCVKISNVQLLIRTLLGVYTIETMIPVYIIIMLLFGIIDIAGTFILLILAAAEIITMTVTHTNSMIHDLLAGTAVVDLTSQMVFGSTDELIEYKKKLHAEAVVKQPY